MADVEEQVAELQRYWAALCAREGLGEGLAALFVVASTDDPPAAPGFCLRVGRFLCAESGVAAPDAETDFWSVDLGAGREEARLRLKIWFAGMLPRLVAFGSSAERPAPGAASPAHP